MTETRSFVPRDFDDSIMYLLEVCHRRVTFKQLYRICASHCANYFDPETDIEGKGRQMFLGRLFDALNMLEKIEFVKIDRVEVEGGKSSISSVRLTGWGSAYFNVLARETGICPVCTNIVSILKSNQDNTQVAMARIWKLLFEKGYLETESGLYSEEEPETRP